MSATIIDLLWPPLHGIPQEGVLKCTRIRLVGLRIDILVLAHLAMAIIKDHGRATPMPGGVDTLVAAGQALDHAGTWPPQTAAPNRGETAVGTFVSDQKALRWIPDGAPLEASVTVEGIAAENDRFGKTVGFGVVGVGILAEEPTVVAIADLVAVEGPTPNSTILLFLRLLRGEGAPKQIAAAGFLTNHGCPPPVGNGDGCVGRSCSLITMGRKGLLVVVGEELKENPNLAKIVHAIGALDTRLGRGQSRQEQTGEDGNDGDNHEKLNQCEA